MKTLATTSTNRTMCDQGNAALATAKSKNRLVTILRVRYIVYLIIRYWLGKRACNYSN